MSRVMTPCTPQRLARAQSGFTIVEMMVALSISMVILLGFAVSFVNMKSTFNSQNSLLQLQDNERLAMTILSTSVGEAGFFPNGSNLNASPAVPIQYTDRSNIYATTSALGGAMSNAQYMFGTPGDLTSTPVKPETMSTAYTSAPGDGLLTCQGAANASTTTNATMRNTFYVDAATNTLVCEVITRAGTAAQAVVDKQPLISNVTSMAAVYGLNSSGAAGGNIDLYKKTADMVAADWNNVKNVKVTLKFVDPNYPNDTSKYISWTQVINVMNNK